jgi:hypothetical protein
VIAKFKVWPILTVLFVLVHISAAESPVFQAAPERMVSPHGAAVLGFTLFLMERSTLENLEIINSMDGGH